MKKIILCFIFIILSVCTVEFILYSFVLRDYKKFYGNLITYKRFPPPSFLGSYKIGFLSSAIQYYETGKEAGFRPILIDEKNIKRPVLLFGCSFTHGTMMLKDNQTLGYKIFERTHRNVYNFGICSGGIQHMLLCIRKYVDKYLSSDKQPEYAIYTYLPNHLFQRLRINIFPFMFNNGTVLHYKFNDSELILEGKRFPFLYRTFIMKSYCKYNDSKILKNTITDKYKNFALANEIFLASKRELEKRYPDIKFVILRYRVDTDGSEEYELPFMWDTLKSEGFIILDSEELIGRQFVYNTKDACEDGIHPSEYAWDLLVPEIVNKLGL